MFSSFIQHNKITHLTFLRIQSCYGEHQLVNVLLNKYVFRATGVHTTHLWIASSQNHTNMCKPRDILMVK